MTTLTDAEAEMIRADLVAIIKNTFNVPILHVIPKVEKLAAQAKRANALEAEYSDCQATLKDERYCHGETIKQLKRASSEVIQAANKRAESAERRLAVAVGALNYAAYEFEKLSDWRNGARAYDKEVGNVPRLFCEDIELIENSAKATLAYVTEKLQEVK